MQSIWVTSYLNFEDKGNILTIAGNREIGKYGKTIVNKVVELFSKKNYVILSGLALGTDSEAHISALNYNLKTFAILFILHNVRLQAN